MSENRCLLKLYDKRRQKLIYKNKKIANHALLLHLGCGSQHILPKSVVDNKVGDPKIHKLKYIKGKREKQFKKKIEPSLVNLPMAL